MCAARNGGAGPQSESSTAIFSTHTDLRLGTDSICAGCNLGMWAHFIISLCQCHSLSCHCHSLLLIVTHCHSLSFHCHVIVTYCPLGAAAAALHHRSSHSGTCNVRSSYRIAAEHKPCSFEPESRELAATELVPLREGSTMQWPFSCGSATEPPKPYSFELESRVTCSRTRSTGGRGSGPSMPWPPALLTVPLATQLLQSPNITHLNLSHESSPQNLCHWGPRQWPFNAVALRTVAGSHGHAVSRSDGSRSVNITHAVSTLRSRSRHAVSTLRSRSCRVNITHLNLSH